MKTLIIIRHAKSSWANIGQDDKERPLNERGKKDAPEMAKRLKDRDLKIDLFASSPAKRAKRTANYFAEEFNTKKDDILIIDELYGAGVQNFYNVIHSLKDKYNTVALFSHNPGITEFVNTLTNEHIDNMPTCAVFAVNIHTDKWASIKDSSTAFLFFDYPKNKQD
jgi:phosphohistidine phosphatase